MITRPLAQSRADQRRFVNRTSETREVLRRVAIASRCWCWASRAAAGARCSTTLLGCWDARRSRGNRWWWTARWPKSGAGSPRCRRAIAATREAGPARMAQELQALALPDGPFGEVVQPAILMELVDLLGDRLAALDRGVCLMIDGISPAVAHGVFGSLRNELWSLEGASWVVAGDAAAKPLFLEPPADAFFAKTVELAPLDPADAAKLLRAHARSSQMSRSPRPSRLNPAETRGGC